MKRVKIVLAFALIVSMFIITSCEEVRQAFQETFQEDESPRQSIGDIIDDVIGSSDFVQKQETKRVQEEYNELLTDLFPTLEEAQLENLMDMVDRDLNKWSNREVSILFLPDRLKEIQSLLGQFFESDEVLLYNGALFVEDDRVRIQIVNPAAKDEVDWYWYETKTGKWRKERAVKLRKDDLDNLGDKTRPLSSFDLSVAHTFFVNALERVAGISGLELPNSVTYYHHSHNRYWTIQLRTERADYRARGDVAGNITDFEMQ